MNILYISKLTGNLFAGPNNSVPAQVRAQAQYDNVLWYNLNDIKRPEWTQNGLDCKNLTDYPSGRLKDLPPPFNHPDLAVIEELYCFPFCDLIHDFQKEKIPYVIIPRSAMTAQGQKKRPLKKIAGNLLYFNRMIRKAAAVQYLTEEEQSESCDQWKVRSFVIPNGAAKQPKQRTEFCKNGIQSTYVGRYEIYQKGLDLMLSAIGAEQETLRSSGFVLNMYGPDQENTLAELNRLIAEHGIGDIVRISGSVFGEDKRQVLLDTDVFIMTSRFEGLPMGMIEALAYGLPVVATLGTNLSDEVCKYGAGWTAENDVGSIRRALRNMVKDRESFAETGKNALRLADTYSWDEIAKRSHEMYLQLL